MAPLPVYRRKDGSLRVNHRRIAKPEAHGGCKWLSDCPIFGGPRLSITSNTKSGPVIRVYHVDAWPYGWNLWYVTRGRFVSYFVRRQSGFPCDCPDSRSRAGRCKHSRALRAALATLPH